MTPRQYYYLDDQRRVFNDVHGVRRSADVFVNLNLRPIMAGEKENYGMKFDKWLHKKLDIIFFLFHFFSSLRFTTFTCYSRLKEIYGSSLKFLLGEFLNIPEQCVIFSLSRQINS